MLEFGPSTASWCLTSVQVIGLTSAWLARIGEKSIHQKSCQWLFFICLALVGAATLGAVLLSPRSCLTAGVTLSLMVLAATWDFSTGRKISATRVLFDM